MNQASLLQHGRDWRLRGVGGGQFGYATFDMNVEAAREKKDSKSKSIDDAKEIKVDFLLAIREDDIADSVR